MSKQPTRRRRVSRVGARAVAIGVAVAALVAILGTSGALATPDERVLERQGRVNHQASAGQADEHGRVTLPPQLSNEDKTAVAQAERKRSGQKATEVPRRWIRPEPPMDTSPRLNIDEPVTPAPAPPAPDRGRGGLVAAVVVATVLLALGGGATWWIRHRRPQPESSRPQPESSA